jgi:uncharacterized membrane protein
MSTTLLQILAIIIIAIVTILVVVYIRKPLALFLNKVLDDEVVANLAASFVILLFVLQALTSMLSYITNQQVAGLLNTALSLLGSFTQVLQWLAYVVGLFFIGYAIMRSRKAEQKKLESEEEEPPA